MRLETARLVIRSFEAHDADSWIALVNDPEVGWFTPPSPPATLETFQGALARRQTMERERGYAMWAVDVKGTDSFIGQCGLYPAESKGPEVELAYHYAPASWGHGLLRSPGPAQVCRRPRMVERAAVGAAVGVGREAHSVAFRTQL